MSKPFVLLNIVEIICFAEHTIAETVFEEFIFTEGPIAVIHTSFCLGFHAFAIHFAG